MTNFEIDQLLAGLRATKELIRDRSNWTSRAMARNARGESVWFGSAEATCWCLEGARGAKTRRNQWVYFMTFNALKRIARDMGWDSIAQANDEGGFETAHAILDRAIAELAVSREGMCIDLLGSSSGEPE